MTPWTLGLVAIATAFFAGGLVWPARWLAFRLGAVDSPGGRRVHAQPTPRLGGIAIYGAVTLGLFVALVVGSKLELATFSNPRGAIGFALGATLVFGVGVFDDVRGLSARIKLIAQMVAATIVVGFGGCLITTLSIPWGASVELGWFAVPATVARLVFVTNAVNLLDGLDGLAAGVTALALGAIVLINGPSHGSVTLVSVALIGACVGFLLHNRHPASVFMGDSGSLFLGFSLAVLSTYASAKRAAGVVTVIPLLVLALPLADAVWAIGRRYVRGLIPTSTRAYIVAITRIFVPDRLHIHHRLVDAGLSQRQAVYVLYGVQVAACVVAVAAAYSVASTTGEEHQHPEAPVLQGPKLGALP